MRACSTESIENMVTEIGYGHGRWGGLLLEGHTTEKNRKVDEDPILLLPPASLQMKILSPEVCSSITSHRKLASGLGLEFKLLFLRTRQLTFAV